MSEATERLRFLAHWFDEKYKDAGINDEVQRDLRRFADEYDNQISEITRLTEQLHQRRLWQLAMGNLWTVVNRRTGKPVPPYDCNEHNDQGMMVYRSREAAECAADHQAELYELDCEARRVDKVIT